MSRNLLIGILVAGALVVGGGYYVTHQATTESDGAQPQTQESGTPPQAGKYSGSFAELAARGGSWKCTVDTSTAQSISSGVTYVSAGKVRGDFTTSVQGYGNVETHMISDGVHAYTWSSMMPQGIETSVSASGAAGGATSGQGVNANTSYSYDCEPWSADMTLFAVPTNITFKMMAQ